MPFPDVPERTDERIGLELRRIRKEKFGDRGSLAKVAKDADVSIALLGAIERGDHPLVKVSQERVTRLAQAYGLSTEQFADLTGLSIVAPVETGRRRVTLELSATIALPIPEALIQAAKKYGGEFASPVWQQELAGLSFRDSKPETPDDWYFLYRSLSNLGLGPKKSN